MHGMTPMNLHVRDSSIFSSPPPLLAIPTKSKKHTKQQVLL